MCLYSINYFGVYVQLYNSMIKKYVGRYVGKHKRVIFGDKRGLFPEFTRY